MLPSREQADGALRTTAFLRSPAAHGALASAVAKSSRKMIRFREECIKSAELGRYASPCTSESGEL